MNHKSKEGETPRPCPICEEVLKEGAVKLVEVGAGVIRKLRWKSAAKRRTIYEDRGFWDKRNVKTDILVDLCDTWMWCKRE